MTPLDESNIIPFPRQAGAAAILQLRVDLILMAVPIWRRLLVPGGMTFWELHVAIQDAMGWRDRHLHQFTVDVPRSGNRLRFGIPDDSGFHGVNEILPGWEYPISRYLKVGGHPALYTYDFGDDWQHEVVLEKVRTDDLKSVLPRCVAGEGGCPAEDSGGPACCEGLVTDEMRKPFDPQTVVFDNPRLRWQRAFGRD